MADPHVISALREKRALVAGLIEKLERKLEQHRADLTHIDGVLRLFQPDRDPGEIKPKRTYARRTRYFARNESSDDPRLEPGQVLMRGKRSLTPTLRRATAMG